MARIIPQYRKSENGNKESVPYAYNVRVFRGYDAFGRELKPYQKTWRVPEGLKDPKRIKRALDRFVGEFETSCNRGEVSNDKRTFSELARYYIELSERDNKTNSTNFYRNMMPLIDSNIGHIKLMNLTTKNLNEFYIMLQKEDVRKDKKARATDKLLEVKAEKKLLNRELQEMTGLGKNTITLVCRQENVNLKTAQAVAKALKCPFEELFEIIPGCEKTGLGEKTIYEYHKFIHSVLELAKAEGYIARNPADNAKPPKQKRKEAKWLEIDEILKIVDAVNQEPLKYKVMLLLLIEAGMRKGELMGLKWQYLNFDACSIRIKDNLQYSPDKGIYETTPKNGEGRLLSISSEVMEVIKLYYLQQKELKDALSTKSSEFNPKNYLFTQINGLPMHPDSIYKWMQKIEQKYNLPHIYPHKFRHSQASILFASGVDIITASKRLGHSQPSTTSDIYAHMLQKMDQKASAAISAAVWNKRGVV